MRSLAVFLAIKSSLPCTMHFQSLSLFNKQQMQKRRFICAGEGGEGGQRASSRDSPHLVVFEIEIWSACEKGVSKPGGVGICGIGCGVVGGTPDCDTTSNATEIWAIAVVTSTMQCLCRVHAVKASGSSTLRIFNPEHKAAASWNRIWVIVPVCGCVTAKGEPIR